MTRTELIARIRSVGTDYDFHENALIFEAADMLEADEAELTDDQLEDLWNAETTHNEDCGSLYYYKKVYRDCKAKEKL